MANRLNEFGDLAVSKVKELEKTNKDKDLQLLLGGANVIAGTVSMFAGRSPKMKTMIGGIPDRGVAWLIRAIARLLIGQLMTASTDALQKLASILQQAAEAIREAIADELQDQGE